MDVCRLKYAYLQSEAVNNVDLCLHQSDQGSFCRLQGHWVICSVLIHIDIHFLLYAKPLHLL